MNSVANWDYDVGYNIGATPPQEWIEGTHVAGSNLVAPLRVREGEYIEEVDVWIIGDGAMTGGYIKLFFTDEDGTLSVDTVADISGVANPWQQVAIHNSTAAGINYTVLPQKDYWIDFSNAAAGPIADTKVYGARFKSRFHEGV